MWKMQMETTKMRNIGVRCWEIVQMLIGNTFLFCSVFENIWNSLRFHSKLSFREQLIKELIPNAPCSRIDVEEGISTSFFNKFILKIKKWPEKTMEAIIFFFNHCYLYLLIVAILSKTFFMLRDFISNNFLLWKSELSIIKVADDNN